MGQDEAEGIWTIFYEMARQRRARNTGSNLETNGVPTTITCQGWMSPQRSVVLISLQLHDSAKLNKGKGLQEKFCNVVLTDRSESSENQISEQKHRTGSVVSTKTGQMKHHFPTQMLFVMKFSF